MTKAKPKLLGADWPICDAMWCNHAADFSLHAEGPKGVVKGKFCSIHNETAQHIVQANITFSNYLRPVSLEEVREHVQFDNYVSFQSAWQAAIDEALK